MQNLLGEESLLFCTHVRYPERTLLSCLQWCECSLQYLLQEVSAAIVLAPSTKPHAAMLRCDMEPGDSHSASWLVVPIRCEQLHLHM